MDDNAPIRSIHRCIAVLQAINRNGTMTVMEVARAVDLPYPTAGRIIQALLHEGMIECEARTKSYRSTALVQTLSQGFRNRDRLIGVARPHIVGLTNAIRWPAAIATRVGQSMMVRDSTHDLTALTFNLYAPGYTLPLLECASGLVYLAHASADERNTVIEGLKLLDTPSALLPRFESGELVLRICQDGYAVCERNPHTHNPGKTSSISVPLFQGRDLVGALTVVIFTSAMPIASAVDRYLGDILATSDAISEALGTSAVEPGVSRTRPIRGVDAIHRTTNASSVPSAM